MTDQTDDKPRTIAEDLEAAFAAADQETPSEESPKPPVEEVPAETVPVEEPPAETVAETPETPVEESVTEEVVEFHAPEHFSDADKKIFEDLPQDKQEWMLGRYKDMEADYTRKTQDHAEFKRMYEPVDQLMEPVKQQLILNGVTPGQYIQRLMTADNYLTTQPKEAIKWLMQTYGVSFDALEDADDTSDPEIQGLRKEITDLRSSIDTARQADQTAQFNSAANQLSEFRAATDEAGKPLYPLLDDVMDDMTRLAHADRAIGKQPDLKELYDRAIWANPMTRNKVLEQQGKEQAEKVKREAAAKAKKAKEAGSSVTGAPAGTEETPLAEMPLRDQLEKQLLQ